MLSCCVLPDLALKASVQRKEQYCLSFTVTKSVALKQYIINLWLRPCLLKKTKFYWLTNFINSLENALTTVTAEAGNVIDNIAGCCLFHFVHNLTTDLTLVLNIGTLHHTITYHTTLRYSKYTLKNRFYH